MRYLTVPLNKLHKKPNFECGSDLLDNYLYKQASQDVKRKLSACFVLTDESNSVKGYYTLSSLSIKRALLPDEIIRTLPISYSDLPVTLLGRLAIDKKFQGKGLGEDLLLDALKRSFDAANSVGSIAVVVDPIDEEAIRFYKKYGFIPLPVSNDMFITMKAVSKLFS